MPNIQFTQITYPPAPLPVQRRQENLWILTDNIRCTVDTRFSGHLIYKVNSGFSTDMRSGPDFLDFLAPRVGHAGIQSSWIIHDVNYEGYLSQKLADQLVYKMLLDADLEKWRCQAVYVGLRTFGATRYRTSRDNQNVYFAWVGRPQSYQNKALSQGESLGLTEDVELSFDLKDRETILNALKEASRNSKDDFDLERAKTYFQ